MSETLTIVMNESPSKGEITVLFSGQSQTDKAHTVGPNMFDYILIHYVQSGKGQLQMRDTTYQLQEGDSFFIFPGELAFYASDDEDPWAYRWIALRGSQAEKLLADSGIGPHRPIVRPASYQRLNTLFERIQSSLEQGGFSGDLEAEGYVRIALAEYSKAHEHERMSNPEVRTEIERQIEQAVRYITLRYYSSISIEQLAQQYGYHRTYFSKMFHEITGESPIQLLIRLRMERARTLLLTTQLSIEQISSSVGYADALYFSKMFKRTFGHSPTAYRKEYQVLHVDH
ncbi:AraC family transcriptional regulator [Paenibacillus aquistagni]|uniref:AraC-type DNA-binding protein n=1 Tax=Paenibacillus aquistagni TaxID=1852522 RepID=A0A1X7JLX5_9BACL|nr:AraC family transcriptional regulator [Paenibacillus aquistagni]NMM54435.1 AraC family transcriptional regulator [Paenibacillus aquistagni]SMG28921.1 AraC-type DNA-binding protein [Paenibacillus aquistagni]